MNTQTAGQMRVKAMCFPSYLMRAVCFPKAQAPDYGHKKSHGVPIKPRYKAFHSATGRNVIYPPLVFGLQGSEYIKELL